MKAAQLLCPLVAASLGCSAETKVVVDVEQFDFDYGLVVLLDESGSVHTVRDVFGTLESGERFGVSEPVAFDDDASRLVLVTMNKENLHPSFAPDRAQEISARIAVPPSDLVRTTALRDRLVRGDVGIPASAMFHEAELVTEPALMPIGFSDAIALGNITLEIPVDPEFCRDPQVDRWAAFGAEFAPLPSGPQGWHPIEMIALNERTLLVAQGKTIHLLERGSIYDPEQPGAMLALVDRPASVSADLVEGMAVSAPGANGEREITVVGALTRNGLENNQRDGFVHTARYSPVDGLAWTDVSTRTPNRRIWSAAYYDDRVWVGILGGLLERSLTSPEFRNLEVQIEGAQPFDQNDYVIELMPVTGGEPSLILGSRNRIHLHQGGPKDGSWVDTYYDPAGAAITESVNFTALSAVFEAGTFDGWGGGSRGSLLRWDQEAREFRPKILDYPPRFSACSGFDPNVDDRLFFNGDIRESAIVGDHVFLAHQDCEIMIAAARREPSCVWIIDSDGLSDVARRDFKAVRNFNDQLIASTTDGEILIAVPAD